MATEASRIPGQRQRGPPCTLELTAHRLQAAPGEGVMLRCFVQGGVVLSEELGSQLLLADTPGSWRSVCLGSEAKARW